MLCSNSNLCHNCSLPPQQYSQIAVWLQASPSSRLVCRFLLHWGDAWLCGKTIPQTDFRSCEKKVEVTFCPHQFDLINKYTKFGDIATYLCHFQRVDVFQLVYSAGINRNDGDIMHTTWILMQFYRELSQLNELIYVLLLGSSTVFCRPSNSHLTRDVIRTHVHTMLCSVKLPFSFAY